MPIYTRTGDRGKTSLFDGTRVFKFHHRVETYGTVDELNSVIGAVIAHLSAKQKEMKKELENIQHDLFDIGSALAMPVAMPIVGLAKRPEEFEKQIDSLTKQLPVLKNFILPSGSKAGSLLHMARTISRRAERHVVALSQKEAVDEHVVKYLNRLSDLLFTMARFVNFKEKKKEIIWRKK